MRDGVLVTTMACEGARSALVDARSGTVGSQLGRLLNTKGLKAGEIANRCDVKEGAGGRRDVDSVGGS